MFDLFNVLLKGFNFDEVMSNVEVIGIRYKDEKGVHDVVLNEELWFKNDDKEQVLVEDDTAGCVQNPVEMISKQYDEDEMSFRNDNDVYYNANELKEGDFVYAKSKAAGIFGIFSHTANDVIYFNATILPNIYDEDGEVVDTDDRVAFNDVCFGVEDWKFYRVTALERAFIDEVLKDNGWVFNLENKKFYSTYNLVN